jgi:hypothetical protein
MFLGERTEGTHYITFYYKVRQAGTLTAGFDGKQLYAEETLDINPNWQQFQCSGNWDGEGDFEIGFTGEILIYGLALRSDALGDAILLMQTQIEQTQEAITMLATKAYVDAQTGDIQEYMIAQFQITAESISSAVERITDLEDASAGWITTAQGNQLWASKEDFDELGNTVETNSSTITQLAASITSVVESVNAITGEEIVSRINQTAEEITIQASKITLEGVVTANQNFKILEDGSMEAKGGRFNGYISFPFKNLSESDAIEDENGNYTLYKDLNIICDIYNSVLYLPDDPSYNGSLVNIFNRQRAWTYSGIPISIELAGNAQFRENMSLNALNNANYVSPTYINSAGGLHQFLCVYDSVQNQVYWVHMNNIVNNTT